MAQVQILDPLVRSHAPTGLLFPAENQGPASSLVHWPFRYANAERACAPVQISCHAQRSLNNLHYEDFEMTTSNAHVFGNARMVAAVVFAGLLGTACESYEHSSPRQIEASNPTVTYKYHNDDELIQTNQLAAQFCDRYQSVPQPANFTTDNSGDRVVIFECVATSMQAGGSYSNNDLTYTYRTDQELMDVSRNARAYCMNSGSSQVVSNIVSNGNGTKTVTFQCRAS